MKNRIIVAQNETKDEFKILFKVETDNKDMNYLIYTKEEENEDGEIIAYAGKYEVENGKQKIVPIADDYTLEFLDSILLQVQRKVNQAEKRVG